MAKLNSKDIKTINRLGEFVDETDESAAFSVNMNDPEAHNFIEGIAKHARGKSTKSRGKSEVKGEVGSR